MSPPPLSSIEAEFAARCDRDHARVCGDTRPPGLLRRLWPMFAAMVAGTLLAAPLLAGGGHAVSPGWLGLLDSNQPKQKSIEQFAFGSQFLVTARSLLLFRLQSESE